MNCSCDRFGPNNLTDVGDSFKNVAIEVGITSAPVSTLKST